MEPHNQGNYWQGEESDNGNVPLSEVVSQNEPLPLEPVSWEASEYIDHDRDGVWFIGFGFITLVLLVLSVFLMKNYVFTALIFVLSIALFIYVKRPPRIVKYTLSDHGLHIGQSFHSFNEYRAFGVVEDGALFAVKLLPTARFGQEIMVYFTEEQGEQIVDIFGSYLPMEELHLDVVDQLLRRLRL